MLTITRTVAEQLARRDLLAVEADPERDRGVREVAVDRPPSSATRPLWGRAAPEPTGLAILGNARDGGPV